MVASPTPSAQATAYSTAEGVKTLTPFAPSAIPTRTVSQLPPIVVPSATSTLAISPVPLTLIPSATPTAPTTTATLTPSPTPTVLASPVVAHVAAITSATGVNDQPLRITVIGDGFVDTSYAIRIGDRVLTDVRVESPTALTGTLLAGLCPGAYSATVTDALGHDASGGVLQLRGTLSVTLLTHDIAAPPIQLVGRVQDIRVALPMARIRDTTCGTKDLHLVVSVSEFAQGEGRPSRLTPLSVAVDGARKTSQPLTQTSSGGTATVLVQRPGGSGQADVALSTEIEIPSHPAAGDYRATVTVALEEAIP
jgi:hypothetical protein